MLTNRFVSVPMPTGHIDWILRGREPETGRQRGSEKSDAKAEIEHGAAAQN